jgi:hypothetical protein
MEKENKKINQKYIPDALKFISDFSKSHKVDKTTLKLIKDFLKIAKNDLECCKILYLNKKYASSTYFLQQSAEKATKAYVLNWGLFSKKEIRQIGHQSLEAYIVLLNKLSNYVSIAKQIYPGMKTDTSNLQNILEDKKRLLELAQTEYKTFITFFNVFDNCRKSFSIELKNIEQLLNKTDIQGVITKGLKSNFKEVDKRVKGKSNIQILTQYYDKNLTIDILNQALDFSLLYIIASFTFPHEQFTRYPDGDLTPF